MNDKISNISDNHPRKYTFILPEKVDNCSYDMERNIQIIFFLSDSKFRSHMAKHFLDTYEYENAFNKAITTKCDFFSSIIVQLQDLKCSHMKGFKSNFVCNYCQDFDSCTKILSKVEPIFLDAIKNAIKNAIWKPRFASSTDLNSETNILSFVSDYRVIAKARIIDKGIHKGVYNLMTCYGQNYDASLNELIWKVKRRIKIESNPAEIKFCANKEWGHLNKTDMKKKWQQKVMKDQLLAQDDKAYFKTLIWKGFK